MARLPENEFPLRVRRLVAERVAQRCSNPYCGQITAGPSVNPDRRAVRVGKAAHIAAAAERGPRYDALLTSEQRRAPSNAIWLCSNCAAMVDDDQIQYPADLLRKWKQRAEEVIERELRIPSKYRAIDSSEIQTELPIEDRLAIKALEEEFGCPVQPDVYVQASNGWIHLDAAVVREEDLIAIKIESNRRGEIRLFQVEHWLQICKEAKFSRFQKCIAYLVVVSSAAHESDVMIDAELQTLLVSSGLDGEIRLYRLSQLRRKYRL